jgi:predicted branched-subunit amino acid permease
VTAATIDMARRRPAVDGVTAMAPLVLAYAPFALVIGAVVRDVDPQLAGWAGSWLIFGGSAHLAALQGLADGTPVVAVATALLVNTRLLVYGASMAPRWRDQPAWFRVIAPAMLIDPTWALAERHAGALVTPADQRRFFLAAALTLGVAWSAVMAAGVLVGDRLPHIGLELAAPLCLIALIGPRLSDRRHRWAAVTAGLVAVVGSTWPAGTGIAAAIAAGTLAAHVAGAPR